MFKKRKWISILLTISMMLTLFPFAAFAEEGGQAGTEQTQQEQTTPANVATQLPNAEDGVITLNQDVALAATHVFSQDVTLKLNGHNIIANDVRALWVKAGTLTIEGQGIITSVKPENGSLDISSSVIRVGDSADSANSSDAKLVLGNGVTVKAPATYGVSVFGKNKSLVADINGTIHSVVAPALAGSGTSGLTATTITLSNTAKLNADQAIAIYHPQAGTMNVNGATVQGAGGIEMKAGTLNVADGSTITATATETAHQANGGGTSTDGYAIVAVDTNGGYVGKVVVNVTGGTVTGPVDKLVDKVPAADNKGSITVSGGTFNQDVTEFLADQKGQNADGSIGELNGNNAVAKIGDTYYGSFSAAIAAANDNAVQDGAVIEVLKDVAVPSAQYVITKNITLKKGANVAAMPKIDVTVAYGPTTLAFNVQHDASLTLDGVDMTITGTPGTKNAEGKGGLYDGTAINLDNTKVEGQKGAKLILDNGAIFTATKLQRGMIFSAPNKPQGTDKDPITSYSSVDVKNGSKLNVENIDGNASNGGAWTVDNAVVNVKNCGDHGLSAQTVTAVNGAAITSDNAGLTAIRAKELVVDSSNVTVTNSGSKLKDNDNYNHAVEVVKGGKLTIKDSTVTLKDNKTDKQTIFANDAVTNIQGSNINAEFVYADPVNNEVRITYAVNGDVYKSFVATKSGDTVTFTEPAAPSVAGYTFKGWNYGEASVKVEDGQVTLTPGTETTFTFTADLVANASPGYNVGVATTDNGSVTVTPQRATAGKTVTITATPDEGYVVDAVSVTDKDGKAVEVTKNANGTYSFTMPKSAVSVKVTFKAAPTEPSELPFTDVNEDDWYYGPVEYVFNNGIMNGTGDGTTFSPNVPLNRAMIAAVLYNLEGGPVVDNDGAFTDVPSGEWYTDAVNFCENVAK